MSFTFRTIFVVALFTIFISNPLKAQPKKEKFIDLSIGYAGINTSSMGSAGIRNSGYYAQAEYVLGLSKWFCLRPYIGVILSDDKTVEQNQYKVRSNAVLLGGKIRVSAPFWYTPYFEIGMGTSIGFFETYTPYTNINHNGMLIHIPWTIGLASFGHKHKFEIFFTGHAQSYVKQFDATFGVGYSFPLSSN